MSQETRELFCRDGLWFVVLEQGITKPQQCDVEEQELGERKKQRAAAELQRLYEPRPELLTLVSRQQALCLGRTVGGVHAVCAGYIDVPSNNNRVIAMVTPIQIDLV
jgi:hypothetical protein